MTEVELKERLLDLTRDVASLRGVLERAEAYIAAAAYDEVTKPPYELGEANKLLGSVRLALSITNPKRYT